MSPHKQAQRLVKFLQCSPCQVRQVAYSCSAWNSQRSALLFLQSALSSCLPFLAGVNMYLLTGLVGYLYEKYLCSLRIRHQERQLYSNCLYVVKQENERCLLTFSRIIILNNLLWKLNCQICLFLNILTAFCKMMKQFQMQIPELRSLSQLGGLFLTEQLLVPSLPLLSALVPWLGCNQVGGRCPILDLFCPEHLLVGEVC